MSDTQEPRSAVHAWLAGLVRRERGVLSGSIALRALGVAGAALAWGAWSAWGGIERSAAFAGLVFVVGAGAFLAVAWPLLRRWAPTGDARRQARLVEAARPALHGQLLVVAERPAGPRPGESAEVLAWVASTALGVARAVTPGEIHPWGALRGELVASTFITGFAAVSLLWAGPDDVARWWVGADVSEALVDAGVAQADEAPAKVGDLTLRYIYPDYTGLEPYEVVNSTGEARALPGTRVEVIARSATPVEGAAVVAYDQPALDARVTDGRVIAGSFTVGKEPGTYRFVTYDHGEARSSKDFPIVPEADLPPEVSVQADAPAIEVAVNAPLELPWTARDDYGLARVVLEIDGKEHKPDVRRPDTRTPTLNDVLSRRPLDLGMQAGQSYQLVVAAWDNDTVSGSKVGRSQPIRIIVLDEDGLARVSAKDRLDLLAILVDLLGDHLEEPWPPGTAGAEYARWGESVNDRYAPLATFLDQFRNRRGFLVTDLQPAGIALAAGRTLVRYTQVTFTPNDRETANSEAVASVAGMRDEAVVTAEEAILALDRLLRNEAYRQVADAAADLVKKAREVTELLARSDLRPDELARAVEDVQATMQDLRELAKHLPEGGLRSFVEQRTSESDALMEETQRALSAGEMERARALMGRASSQMEQMSQGIEDELQRMIEQAKKKQGQAKDLIEELKKLAAAQDALAARVQAIREESEAGKAQALRDAWARIDAQSKKVHGLLDAYTSDLTSQDRPFNERELAEWARTEADRAGLAVEMRDLGGSQAAAFEMQRAWQRYAMRYGRQAPGVVPGATESAAVAAEIGRLTELLDGLRQLDNQVAPQAAGQLRALEAEQEALRGQLTQAQDEAKKLAQEFPVRPRGMEQALDKSNQRMGEAGEALGKAQGLTAQGAEQAAAEHIREAIRSLQQAMSSAGRSQQALEGKGEGQGKEGGQGGQEGEEGRDGGEEGEEGEGEKPGEEGMDGRSNPNFDLPEPEEFATPEEYRRALIEGMSGDVPEEYRALKRRYYEELVQ